MSLLCDNKIPRAYLALCEYYWCAYQMDSIMTHLLLGPSAIHYLLAAGRSSEGHRVIQLLKFSKVPSAKLSIKFILLWGKQRKIFWPDVQRRLGGCSDCAVCASPWPSEGFGDYRETGENDSGKVTALSMYLLLCVGGTGPCIDYDQIVREKGDNQNGVWWWYTLLTLLCWTESHTLYS